MNSDGEDTKTEPMKTDNDLEKELYDAIDTFTGNREMHTPSLVKELKVIVTNQVAAERERIKDTLNKVQGSWSYQQVIELIDSL